MKPTAFTVAHNNNGAVTVYQVQPVSREYCTDYDLENHVPNADGCDIPYHCHWLSENSETLVASCIAFRKQIIDLGCDDSAELRVPRLPECIERERIVALEAHGQVTIEQALEGGAV